jgi:hypothetical protein
VTIAAEFIMGIDEHQRRIDIARLLPTLRKTGSTFTETEENQRFRYQAETDVTGTSEEEHEEERRDERGNGDSLWQSMCGSVRIG